MAAIPVAPGRRPLFSRTALDLDRVRRDLQRGRGRALALRRAIVGLSLLGIADMAAVALFQTGILRSLPDPPWRRFDSAKANSSDAAYQLGAPDGVLLVAALAANAALAAFGSSERAERAPAVPLAAAAKAGIEAGFAAKYFSLMARRREPWCLFCIGAAVIQLAIFGLTLPEARRATRRLRSGPARPY